MFGINIDDNEIYPFSQNRFKGTCFRFIKLKFTRTISEKGHKTMNIKEVFDANIAAPADKHSKRPTKVVASRTPL